MKMLIWNQRPRPNKSFLSLFSFLQPFKRIQFISPIGQATTVDGEQLGKRFPNEEFLLLSVNVMFPNSQCFLKESMLFKSGSIKNNENVNLESTTSFE